ncbi:MAG: hypothetical protein OHK0012_22850 [Synechococcales cyanobacterium]
MTRSHLALLGALLLSVGCGSAAPVAFAPLDPSESVASETSSELSDFGDASGEEDLITAYVEDGASDRTSPCTWHSSSSATAKRDLSGTVNPMTGVATLRNRSTQCTYPVGLASYQMVDKGIDSQILFQHQTTTIAPGQELTLQVGVPGCAFQIDLFFGDVITQFKPGVRYSHRLINASKNGMQTYKSPYNMGFCPKGQPTPAPVDACVDNPTLVGGLFNIYLSGDLTQSHTDAEGRVAVGGKATLLNYSVGEKLSRSNGQRDDLIVGHTLNFRQGTVVAGNAVYGVTGQLANVTFPSGRHRQDQPLNFSEANRHLQQLSQYWQSLAGNGTATVEYGQIRLVGTHPQVNVFQVNGRDLSAANTLSITAPAAASVLVNVSGVRPDFDYMGIAIQGVNRNKVIYHFPEATSLTVTGIGIEGSIVAPKAAIAFDHAVIHGNVIGQSLLGSGQSNHDPFVGCLPAPRTSLTVASLLRNP